MMSLLEPVINLQVYVTDCISPSTLPIRFLLFPVTIHPCPKMQSPNMIQWSVWCCMTQHVKSRDKPGKSKVSIPNIRKFELETSNSIAASVIPQIF